MLIYFEYSALTVGIGETLLAYKIPASSVCFLLKQVPDVEYTVRGVARIFE